MLDLILDKIGDPHFMAVLLVALGCAATTCSPSSCRCCRPTICPPHQGGQRPSANASASASANAWRPRQNKTPLRVRAEQLCSSTRRHAQSDELARHRDGQDAARHGRLSRRRAPNTPSVLSASITPIAFCYSSDWSIFSSSRNWTQPLMIKIGVAIGAIYVGIKAPEIYPAQHDRQAARSRSSAPIRTRSICC